MVCYLLQKKQFKKKLAGLLGNFFFCYQYLIYSNITAGNRVQIQAVIESNVFPLLSNKLANADFDVKKEAAWAIANATSGTPEISKNFPHHKKRFFVLY